MRRVDRGIEYLRTTQNEDGSWSPQPGPAVTAIVVAAMLDRPNISVSDPSVAKAVAYILSKRRSDGGIHDGFLENYNTAICLSAWRASTINLVSRRRFKKRMPIYENFSGTIKQTPMAMRLTRHMPTLAALDTVVMVDRTCLTHKSCWKVSYESGMDCNDPIFIRALAFITRCQGTKANREFGDKIVADGGFVYATSVNKDHIGVPQSMASPALIDQAKAGKPISGLRTYGSMTYAGFKSYIYANLDRDDPRVVDAYNWIRHHYTLDHNPGLLPDQQMQGYYYYLVTFSRAMAAWGSDQIITADGATHDWANDLVGKLAGLQREDGSWVNTADRWMEGDVNLTTAYALTALVYAIR